MNMGTPNVEEPSILGIEEIAIAVKDAEEGASLFKDLFGFDFELKWEIPFEKIKVKSHRIGKTQLQFLTPTSQESVVAKFIEQKGEGLNHIALRVKNLKALIVRLKERGVQLVPQELLTIPNPLGGSASMSYIFIHPKSALGVLIELIEY